MFLHRMEVFFNGNIINAKAKWLIRKVSYSAGNEILRPWELQRSMFKPAPYDFSGGMRKLRFFKVLIIGILEMKVFNTNNDLKILKVEG